MRRRTGKYSRGEGMGVLHDYRKVHGLGHSEPSRSQPTASGAPPLRTFCNQLVVLGLGLCILHPEPSVSGGLCCLCRLLHNVPITYELNQPKAEQYPSFAFLPSKMLPSPRSPNSAIFLSAQGLNMGFHGPEQKQISTSALSQDPSVPTNLPSRKGDLLYHTVRSLPKVAHQALAFLTLA